jgi:hypothetical protein
MIHLASADVARCQRQIPTEEKGDGEMSSTYHSNGDRLSPANVSRRHSHLDVRRIETGGPQFHGNAVSDDGVVLATFTGDSGPDCGSRLLADPDVNQAAKLDDAKQHGQKHERDDQYCLERFLPTLSATAPRTSHEVCVSRCTI